MCARIACIIIVLIAVFTPPARAGTCSSPSGNEGDMIYNSDYHVMQYCNGIKWKAIGKLSADINANRYADWKFDDGSGTTAADSSGNGNTGTLVNGASWGTGQVNGAIFIDASDDANDDNNPQVDLGTGFELPSVPFTITAWIKPTNYTDWRTIIGKRDTGGSGTERFELQLVITTGTVRLSSSNATAAFTYAPPTGSWTHLALVVSASQVDLYVNGAFQETSATAFTFADCAVPCHAAIGDNGEWLTKGGTGISDSDPFKGYIDELRVYARALSASEVASVYGYTSTTPATCSNPAGTEGQILYNQASHVIQICDNTGWRAAGPVPGAGGAGCTNPAGSEGHMIYNSASHIVQYCDGTNWYPMGRCQHGIYSFTDATAANPSTVTASNILNLPSDFYCTASHTISITGSGSPQFQICSDSACSSIVTAWGSASQTISNGQYVQMRLTSSASLSTALSATLTVDSASTTWNVTTRGPMKVFVTSTTTKGLFGTTGGIANGDLICNNLALAAGVSGTYKAWLAITSATDDPNTRMTHQSFAYADTTGTTVANNWTGLISGTLVNAFSKDERGNAVAANQRVWTNVTANTGTTATVSGSANGNCIGWTNNGGGAHTAWYGLTGSATATWTKSNSQTCNNNAHLYCIEQ
jgi:hypothetical protein